MRKAIYLLFFLVWLCPAACMAQGLHFGLKAGVLGNKADIQGISNRVKTENINGIGTCKYKLSGDLTIINNSSYCIPQHWSILPLIIFISACSS